MDPTSQAVASPMPARGPLAAPLPPFSPLPGLPRASPRSPRGPPLGPAHPTSRSAQKRALGPAATSLRALASAAAPLGPPVSRPSPLARVARCLRYASDPPGPHVGAAPPAAAPASLSLPSWPHPPGRRLPHAAHPSLLARARVSDPSLPFLLARVRPSSPPRISPRLRPPRHGHPDPACLLKLTPRDPLYAIPTPVPPPNLARRARAAPPSKLLRATVNPALRRFPDLLDYRRSFARG